LWSVGYYVRHRDSRGGLLFLKKIITVLSS
jgi:hypothetical protein